MINIGNIQFGIPPETIKDCLILGLDVPNYYILPTVWFDRSADINTAEFEFPAYFNFFVRKKKINLVCSSIDE
jgi:hypothetical protein